MNEANPGVPFEAAVEAAKEFFRENPGEDAFTAVVRTGDPGREVAADA